MIGAISKVEPSVLDPTILVVVIIGIKKAQFIVHVVPSSPFPNCLVKRKNAIFVRGHFNHSEVTIDNPSSWRKVVSHPTPQLRHFKMWLETT